jgi:hypothetical protein
MRTRLLVAALPAALAAACTTRTVVVTPEPARGRSASVHVLGVPPGHLPPPGQCRVWIRGVPPGQQARARSCVGIAATAPAGSWILYRPSRDRRLVHVRVVHEERPGVVVVVRMFEAGSGRFVEERAPGREDEDDAGERGERGRGRRRP